MRIRTVHRVSAVLLMKLFLLDIFQPTLAFALTSGPSQPEFESFEPVSTDQMVDLFTGDFNYNIPLMTVPGPNGGYPINLAYHAGIGMEQEASWVGLGWNINAGEISRQMRGLPDDFDGDPVTKTTKMKDDVTVSVGTETPVVQTEVLGARLGLTTGYSYYYNTYRGVGHSRSLGASFGFDLVNNDQGGSPMNLGGVEARATLGMDSQTGLAVPMSTSLKGEIKDQGYQTGLGATWTSRGGWDQLRLNHDYRLTLRHQVNSYKLGATLSASTGMDFARPTSPPAPFAKTQGFDIRGAFSYGTSSVPFYVPGYTLFGAVASQTIQQEERTLPAYGFLYAHKRTGTSTGLMDLDRENNAPMTKYIHNAPVPSFTYDPFMIKGQGIGGTFRAYRSNMGLVYDEALTTESEIFNLELEVGTGLSAHVGVSVADGLTHSYTGPWTSGTEAITTTSGTDLNYRAGDAAHPLYEPAFFRSTSELTASKLDRWDAIGKEDPTFFMMGRNDNGDYKNAPFAQNFQVSGSIPDQDRARERERRAQLITYRTNNEVRQDPAYTQRAEYRYGTEEDPLTSNSGQPIDYEQWPAHHIGEITVTNTDGSRYVYGLPAYNTVQKEVISAMSKEMANDWGDVYPGRVGLADTDADTPIIAANLSNNNNGQDHFYSATQLSPYSHTHLLTAIYSTDYVDLKNDGPTDDDLGYYVKFNYTTGGLSSYKWRMPYKGFHYQKGAYSNNDDDRVAYSYGEREVYYLHSIETKTHIARFRLNDENTAPRQDDRPASDENGYLPATIRSRFLDRIDLYSKDQPTQVLKSVDLIYDADYPLCPGTDNSTAATAGKLTLHSVRFLNMGSERGALSPYVFDYGNASDPNTNPNYDYIAMDRWGYYKPTPGNSYYTNSEHPYVEQTGSVLERNAHASAWCLRKITLPSGGTVEVNYEADDYAYVQDHPAMQMCRIVDIGNEFNPEATRAKIRKNDLKIWFQMNSPEDNPNDYIDGLDRVYFKVWVDLKKRTDEFTDRALDYVEGYARVDHQAGVGKVQDKGYFSVWPEDYGHGDFPVHPFRLAAWQYLRFKRPDLFQTINIGNGASPAAAVLGVIDFLFNPLSDSSPLNLLTGYYTMANIKGFAKEIQLEDEDPRKAKPSFVRLYDKGDMRKYGGGHRVASIVVHDNWADDGSRAYGKKYTYECVGEKDVNRNGHIDQDGVENNFHYSSGVASYEPMIGGEENALHRPVYYGNADNELSFNDDQFYLEEPFNESYYPAPLVGYSRVVVTDFSPDPYADQVTRTANGVTVHEFYTAKDFPVISRQTGLAKTHYANWIPIPLLGSEEYNNNGYAQGYSIELNDMHGQLKSISQYRNTDDLSGTPVRRTTYYYSTDPDNRHRLNNKVDVLTADMTTESAYLGQTVECFTDMDEHGTVTDDDCEQMNVDLAAVFPILTLYPVHNHVESLYRGLVTNKVIEKHGILERIVTEDEGAITEQRNLAYDAATGVPLLTSVTNSFGDPVYTYNYAAHNSYSGMDAAYKNVGAWIGTLNTPVTISGGVANIPHANEYFHPGDEVEVWNTSCTPDICDLLFVESVTTGQVTFQEADATPPPNMNGTLHIRRSGHRNLLTASNGSIVSRVNFVESHTSMAELFNTYVFGNSSYLQTASFQITQPDPDNPLFAETGVGPYFDTNFDIVDFAVEHQFETKCNLQIIFNHQNGINLNSIFIGNKTTTFSTITINNETNTYQEIELIINGVSSTGWVLLDEEECVRTFMGVLHADAEQMRDNWEYDYGDHGNPIGEGGDLLAHPGNDYRYGRKGIWRPWSNYLYQVDRLKGPENATNIRKDGEYSAFIPFDFTNQANNDPHWHQRDEVLRYSPYGFALESKDAVGNHASELYGYNNSQVVASATNANYNEIAFDGFEDHGTSYQSGHGHMALTLPDGSNLGAPGHTGKKCLYIGQGAVTLNSVVGASPMVNWVPEQGQRYTVSAWFHSSAAHPRIRLVDTETSASIAPEIIHDDGVVIDGWRKVDVEFIAPASGTHMTIAFDDAEQGPFWIDDIRLHPTDAAMSTFVYDRGLYWLKATLDDRNYATFYNYDEEGVLTQVKRETERGVQTLRTTRQNLQHIQ